MMIHDWIFNMRKGIRILKVWVFKSYYRSKYKIKSLHWLTREREGLVKLASVCHWIPAPRLFIAFAWNMGSLKTNWRPIHCILNAKIHCSEYMVVLQPHNQLSLHMANIWFYSVKVFVHDVCIVSPVICKIMCPTVHVLKCPFTIGSSYCCSL